MRKVFLRIHRYQFHKLTKFIIGRQNSYILICILFDLVFLYIYMPSHANMHCPLKKIY